MQITHLQSFLHQAVSGNRDNSCQCIQLSGLFAWMFKLAQCYLKRGFWKLMTAIGTQYHTAFHETRTKSAAFIILFIKFCTAKRTLCFHSRWKYPISLKAIPPTSIARVMVKIMMPDARFQPSSRPSTAIVATHGIYIVFTSA